MRITNLKIAQFKNYESLNIDFDSRMNCIVGQNGAGKTNLLEAIYCLSMIRGLFGLTDRQLILESKEWFRLEGLYQVADKAVAASIKYAAGKKRRVSFNGVEYEKFSEHIGRLPITCILPDDSLILKESAESRRVFMNVSLSQLDPQYLYQLSMYQRLLKQRNAALKANHYPDKTLLDILTQQMSAPAQQIIQARASFLEELIPKAQAFFVKLGGEGKLNLKYKPNAEADQFLEAHQESYDHDCRLRRTNKGPHRDELDIQLNDRSLRKYGSQGQVKLVLICLKLGFYSMLSAAKELQPILMLDDVFDKLDPSKVARLVQLLATDHFGQVFITDTDPMRLRAALEDIDISTTFFHVRDGEIIS